MLKLTLNEVKNIYTNDSITRKANKSANKPILTLIDLIKKPNATIEVIEGKGGLLSRGVVVECLIKMLFNQNAKWSNSGYDMQYKGVNYEIKYSSSKGYAHYNPNQDLSNLIFVNQYGVYLTSGKNIVLDKCGKHIQDIKMNNNVKTLLEF